MKWRIEHLEFPDGDLDRVVLINIEQVWNFLEAVQELEHHIEDVEVRNKMDRLFGGDDPLAWMRLYNDNTLLPNERLRVCDLEESEKELL